MMLFKVQLEWAYCRGLQQLPDAHPDAAISDGCLSVPL
jgi:hypothetical protein